MIRFWISSLLLTSVTLLWSGDAQAHRQKYPKSLTIDIRETKILFTVTYTVNPGQEASMLRALYDRDSSGRLDGQEQERLTEFLEKSAVMFLRVKIDNDIARLVQLDSVMQRASTDVEASKAMGIQLRFSTPLPEKKKGETFTFQVIDRDKDARKHVPTVLDIGKSWSVISANQGEFHPTTRQILKIKLNEENTLNTKIRRGPRPKKMKEEG